MKITSTIDIDKRANKAAAKIHRKTNLLSTSFVISDNSPSSTPSMMADFFSIIFSFCKVVTSKGVESTFDAGVDNVGKNIESCGNKVVSGDSLTIA